MSDTNQITVRGWVGTDPDILVTSNGKEITRFRVASTRRFRDATGEWRDSETEWFTVKTWGQAGVPIRDSIRRGMPVIVQGTLSCEQWESNDRTHQRNVITTGTVSVDIKQGRVTYTKVTREVPADDGDPHDGEGNGQVTDGVVHDGAFPGGPPTGDDGVTDPTLAPPPVDDLGWEKVEVDA